MKHSGGFCMRHLLCWCDRRADRYLLLHSGCRCMFFLLRWCTAQPDDRSVESIAVYYPVSCDSVCGRAFHLSEGNRQFHRTFDLLCVCGNDHRTKPVRRVRHDFLYPDGIGSVYDSEKRYCTEAGEAVRKCFTEPSNAKQ